MWITHPTLGKTSGMFEFKKDFVLSDVTKKEIIICADTKYRLYVNGSFVALGPCKKSDVTTFYDKIDITEYLCAGKNTVTVSVVHLPSELETKDGFYYYTTLKRTANAALMIEDSDISTDETWLVSKCGEYSLNMNLPNILSGGFDITDYNKYSRDYVNALVLSPTFYDDPLNFSGEMNSWILKERPIPMLTYTRKEFLPYVPNSEKFALNAGYETTGVVHLSLSGEKGSKIKILFAESYFKKSEQGVYKDIRDDETGVLTTQAGDFFDTVILDGNPHEYVTFSMRAFRFIQIEIEGNAKVENIYYNEIKYPLTVDADFISSDTDSKDLWDISIRTLNNCMHDSFEDCPFYEQIEYAMDSRLQALFLRQLSPDRRLIKKCITDFYESAFPDGMIQARISARRQIIPGFAFHYIYMIHDYMLYDGDKEFIKSLIPSIDGILEWMDERMENGILGALGSWSYVDWVSTWSGGIPSRTEPLAVYNFMYILALENAAELCEFAGRYGLAHEYQSKIDGLRKKAKEVFYNSEKKYYMDTPTGGFSMHGQIWSVLADIDNSADTKDLLERTFNDKELPICSYSMMFFVFRALEKADMYKKAYELLDGWREMIRKHCSTWVENGMHGRSECHGWGSTPIYEFASKILGVRPCAYGYETVLVNPYTEVNDFAKGTVSTTKGNISVSWKKENGLFTLNIKTEFNVEVPVIVILPNGALYKLKHNNETFVCKYD